MSRRKQRNNPRILTSLNDVNKITKPVHVSFAMVLILVVAILMIGFIYQKIKLNRLVNSMDNIQAEQNELLETVENLKAEKLNLKNMTRIVNIASNSIGMTTSSPFVVIESPYPDKRYNALVQEIEEEISSMCANRQQL